MSATVPEITCAAATGDDYAVAAQLRSEMSLDAGCDYDATYPGWRDRFVAYFHEKRLGDTGCIFIGRVDGSPAGIMAVAVLDHYRGPVFGMKVGYVYSMFVRPEWRGRGVARKLIETGVSWLRERGCATIRLRAGAKARTMYEHLGFVPTAEMELQLD